MLILGAEAFVARLFVGTSGYAYKEWLGTFYPPKFPQSKMLGYYSGRFKTVEINYTFYHMPTTKTAEAWIPQTPEGFLFTLKGNKNVTHIARLRDASRFVEGFLDGAAPLANAGRLGPILWQLPPQMRLDLPLLEEFLASLPKRPALRWVMEFRHPSWFVDGVYYLLNKNETALCVAETDEERVPDVTTGPFAYYRLRKTDYSEGELEEWRGRFEKLLSIGRNVFVYFKHEELGSGPMFAMRLLGQSEPPNDLPGAGSEDHES